MALKTFLTPEEIKAMISQALNLRDKMIISFLADTGCRVSELLQLNVAQIDFDQKLVLIPHLKVGLRKRCPSCGRSTGRRQNFCPGCGAAISEVVAEGVEKRTRLINVGEQTLNLCREYIDRRAKKSEKLVSLTRQMVYIIIRKCAAGAGLGGKIILNPETGQMHYVHPHGFRDSLAVDWLTLDDSGDSQKLLQDHLGHKRYETTARYFKLQPAAVAKTADEVRRYRFGD